MRSYPRVQPSVEFEILEAAVRGDCIIRSPSPSKSEAASRLRKIGLIEYKRRRREVVVKPTRFALTLVNLVELQALRCRYLPDLDECAFVRPSQGEISISIRRVERGALHDLVVTSRRRLRGDIKHRREARYRSVTATDGGIYALRELASVAERVVYYGSPLSAAEAAVEEREPAFFLPASSAYEIFVRGRLDDYLVFPMRAPACTYVLDDEETSSALAAAQSVLREIVVERAVALIPIELELDRSVFHVLNAHFSGNHVATYKLLTSERYIDVLQSAASSPKRDIVEFPL